jgi:molybdopterin-guanine dinucleotide biosynthesis protein A
LRAAAAAIADAVGCCATRVTQTTLAILAGGEGSRMGRPKAELRVAGKPILAYLLERFAWSGPTILVTAPGRERPPGAEEFDREVSDPVTGEGPLRGVLTALEATSTDILVVASCDMPMIEPRQLHWLAERLAAEPAATPVMLMKHGASVEPLPLGIRRDTLNLLRAHVTAGNRSLRSLGEIRGARTVAAPDDWPATTWTNLNTPADLAAFLDQPGVS